MFTVTKSFDLTALKLSTPYGNAEPLEEEYRFSVDVCVTGTLIDRSGYITALNAIELRVGPVLRKAYHRRVLIDAHDTEAMAAAQRMQGRSRANFLPHPVTTPDLAVHLLTKVMAPALHSAELFPVGLQVRCGIDKSVSANIDRAFWEEGVKSLSRPMDPDIIGHDVILSHGIGMPSLNATGQENRQQRQARAEKYRGIPLSPENDAAGHDSGDLSG